MLVMLIIFLVTIPVILKTVPVQLADLSQHRHADQAGKHRHRGRSGRDSLLQQRHRPIDRPMLKNLRRSAEDCAGGRKPLPEVHIRGDKDVRFEAIGRVILACQQAGIQKVGFLTEPHNALEANS